MIQELQYLYDCEINFSISCFWDGGFDAKIGDEMNGFVRTQNLPSIALAIEWIVKEAKAHYDV